MLNFVETHNSHDEAKNDESQKGVKDPKTRTEGLLWRRRRRNMQLNRIIDRHATSVTCCAGLQEGMASGKRILSEGLREANGFTSVFH